MCCTARHCIRAACRWKHCDCFCMRKMCCLSGFSSQGSQRRSKRLKTLKGRADWPVPWAAVLNRGRQNESRSPGPGSRLSTRFESLTSPHACDHLQTPRRRCRRPVGQWAPCRTAHSHLHSPPEYSTFGWSPIFADVCTNAMPASESSCAGNGSTGLPVTGSQQCPGWQRQNPVHLHRSTGTWAQPSGQGGRAKAASLLGPSRPRPLPSGSWPGAGPKQGHPHSQSPSAGAIRRVRFLRGRLGNFKTLHSTRQTAELSSLKQSSASTAARRSAS